MAPADELLGHAAAGLRLALTLLAVMCLLARRRASLGPDVADWHRRLDASSRLNAVAWVAMAIGAICFSPLRSAVLLGADPPAPVEHLTDVVASLLFCAGFALRLAARGHLSGLSPQRVRRGLAMNALIVVLMIASTWIAR